MAAGWTRRAVPSHVRYGLVIREHSPGRLGFIARLRVRVTDSAFGRAMQRAAFALPPHSRVRRLAFRLAVRLSIQALLAKDRRGVRCFYANDAEIIVPPWPGLAERYVGADGFLDFFEAWVEGWDEFVLEVSEFFDTGEMTLVLGRMYTRGVASGVRTTQIYSSVQKYRDGKIVHGEWFLTWEEGMEAAGLEGEPLPS